MKLKELLEMVANYNEAQDNKKPETDTQRMTYSKLKKMGLPELIHINNHITDLIVYKNGLAIYSDLSGEKPHHTVFTVTDMKLYYSFNQHDCPVIRINDYPTLLECEADDIIKLCGQDRIEHNANSREAYHNKGYLDENGNHYESASDTIRRPKDFSYDDFTDAIIDMLEPNEHELLLKKLRKVRKKLTAIQAEVIYLRFEEEMTQDEIAVKLGKSRSTIQKHLNAALKKLKKEIMK